LCSASGLPRGAGGEKKVKGTAKVKGTDPAFPKIGDFTAFSVHDHALKVRELKVREYHFLLFAITKQ
jgi:hypothetical protein